MALITETIWHDQGVEKTYTSAHADERCTRARNARVVARPATLDEALDGALWPCSACVSIETLGGAPEPEIDRAEVEHEARRQAQQAERERQTRREHGAGPLRPAVPADVEVIGGRTNRYAGPCAACGGHVAENGGLLAKRAGKFTVVHRTGADCREPEPRPAPTAQSPAALPDVPEGHYAIASTGSNDLAFYRVDRPTDGEYAGRVFVKAIVGGHPDRNVPRAQVPGILTRIAETGVEESARRYGQEIGRCCRCNRTLTDDESRAAGIGPECRRRT